MIKVTLFFSYGVSIKVWHESGFLSRELSYYKDLIDQRNIEIQFLTYGDETDLDFDEVPDGINITPIYNKIKKPKTRLGYFINSLIFPIYFQDELSSSDLFKTNQIWGSWSAVIAKFYYKIPLFVRVGYDLDKNSIVGEKSLYKRLFIKLISRMAYRVANDIWVPTQEISEFIQRRHKLSKNNITIFPNWIDTDLFNSIENIKPFNNRLLYIGRLSKEKNVTLLVRSLHKTGIGLDIVGNGEEKNDIKTLAKDLNISINFLGRVENKELPSLINHYTVLVLCSHYEGSPKVLLEAMSCKRAVIGTNKPGIKNIIINQINGLICESNPSSLASCIIELIEDKEKTKKLGIQARKYIIANHSKNEAIKKEVNIYNNLIKNNKSG
tara:strand:- start:8623 stop:9768 length:1146 start_codon:yes stop_codon:yes gene_type:complete